MWLFDFPLAGRLFFEGKVFFDKKTCPDCGEVLIRRGWLDYILYLQDILNATRIVQTSCKGCGAPLWGIKGTRMYDVWLDSH